MSAKLTFKIVLLGGYVFGNVFFFKFLNTDSENVPTQIHDFERRLCTQLKKTWLYEIAA